MVPLTSKARLISIKVIRWIVRLDMITQNSVTKFKLFAKFHLLLETGNKFYYLTEPCESKNLITAVS